MKFRVTFHRVVSWWLGIFSILTILSGYAASRKWFANREFMVDAHIVLKWSFVVLFLIHIIYTLAFVKIGKAIRRNPGKHKVRVVQGVSKWLVLAFGFLIILTGFSQYEWTGAAFHKWLPFWVHKVFDVGLTISIIVHTMAGVKVISKRNKIEKVWFDVLIWVVGIALMAGIIFLEVTMNLL